MSASKDLAVLYICYSSLACFLGGSGLCSLWFEGREQPSQGTKVVWPKSKSQSSDLPVSSGLVVLSLQLGFSHLLNGNKDDRSLVGSMWRYNKIMNVKCSACSQGSIN